MNSLLVLLKKDFLLELRSLESIVQIMSLSIILSVITALGVNSALLNQAQLEKLFPALLWIVFLFSSTIAVSRSFEFEQRDSAYEGVLLTGVSPALIFLSKLVMQSALVLPGFLMSHLLLGLLLDLNVFAATTPLLPVFSLSVIGYNALSLIISAMAGSSRLRVLLVPILLLPLLFPLFFCGIELTYITMRDLSLDLESIWLSILVGLDVLYLALGLNLYEHVICE